RRSCGWTRVVPSVMGTPAAAARRRPCAVASAARVWWTFTSRSRGSSRTSGAPAATASLSRTRTSSTVPRTRVLTGETWVSTNASSVEMWRSQYRQSRMPYTAAHRATTPCATNAYVRRRRHPGRARDQLLDSHADAGLPDVLERRAQGRQARHRAVGVTREGQRLQDPVALPRRQEGEDGLADRGGVQRPPITDTARVPDDVIAVHLVHEHDRRVVAGERAQED